MNPIVENLTLRKNNFSKWLAAALTLLSTVALYIILAENKKDWWLALIGMLLFGGMFYFNLRSKIFVSQQGMVVKDIFREREIQWQEISSLKYHTVYHGHGLSLVLTVRYGSPVRSVLIHVKQYRKKEMQRLFEILDEQCGFAVKNDHFTRKASGEMSWKDKLKMY